MTRKNIFVKFVFLCVLLKVEKFATKDRLLINQSHHHTIPPIGNLINPFSNHHTIITPKSIELRNIYSFEKGLEISFKPISPLV